MSAPMKLVKPTVPHEAFRQDFNALLAKHGASMSAQELLAVSAYFVGQLVAMQDQRRMTPADAIELVQVNLAQGNHDVIAARLGKAAGRA